MSVRGIERVYWLSRPYGPASRIVLSLHGRGSNALGQAWLADLARRPRAGDAVLVYPQGGIARQGPAYDWDHLADRDYLDEVVAAVRAEVNVPGRAVYLTGMSAGARMASVYACQRAALVAGLGAVAGLRPPSARPSVPIRVVAFHGRRDRRNPYEGGRGPRWDESVPESARRWAVANGLEPSPVEAQVSPTVHRTTYGAGSEGEVTLWTFADAGHTWPGRPPRSLLFRALLGRTSRELDATEEMLRFFATR